MTKINHMKKFSKSEDKKTKDTKEKDNRKYKKGDDSGSESDEEKKYSGSGSGSDGGRSDDGGGGGGGEKFDMLEYRKMLAEIFPSKYMNERISKLESKEKIAKSTSTTASNMAVCASNTSNKKSNKNENDKNKENNEDSNRKITRSMAKEMDIKPKELKPVEKGKKRGSHNPPPPLPIQDEYDTSSTSTNCSDSEDQYSRSGSGSEDDKYSAGFGEFAKEQLQSGKFNIVINLVNDKKHSNLDEDDSEYDSEEDSEYDDDDDDDSDYDSEEDDSEYDDDDDTESDPNYNPDVDMDESENTIVSNDIKDHKYNYKSGKSYKTSTHGGDRKSSYKGKNGRAGGTGGSGGVVGAKGAVSTEAESLETIQKIKKQMEDILKCNKHDSIARETLGIMVKKEKEYKDREEKKIKSRQKNHVKMFKKMLHKKNSTNDLKYFKDNLTTEEQTDVLKELEDLNKLTITDKPYRLSLLQSDIPQAFKAIALKKITNLRHMEPGAGEYYKIKNWVDTFMQIPFGKHCNLPLTISDGIEKCHDFMENAKAKLDSAVYGLNDAKMQIMQMMGQWIANPAAMGTAIAINGPYGTGKTSLVKEGISKILNREFAFIPLGGATDSSYLEGHSYTYEGSTWGKIVDILIRSKSMNPVIYFDELDKISETPKGEEIIGILTHLTDTTQNSQFHDKYFAEIDFDLSKCLFIFSYNDPLKVNPILLDRMYKIKTTGYKVKDKIVIAKQYLIPKIRYEVNFKEGDIIIPDETLNYIIDNYTEKEDGVRNLKRCIEIVYKKLNLYRLVKPGTTLFEKDNTLVVQFPFTVTNEIVNNLIKKDESGIGKAAINMYL
jgi:hypothetical protein